MRRRTRLGIFVAGMTIVLTATAVFFWPPIRKAEAADIMVYKSPTCGCCNGWVKHLRESGFNVKTEDRRDVSRIKHSYGVVPRLASCHTAVVDGYVVEGHVPAEDIRRLLKERPAVVGITAPGMPMGSPGMEGPRKDRYQVLTIDKDGKKAVFANH